jgi:pilus assembly protein FimV
MRMNKSAVALAFLLGASLAADAAGLGKLTISSSLGQVLNAEIDLVSIQGGEADTVSARVAPPEAYRDARIEYAPSLRLLRFSVEKRQNGQPYLKVTSIGPINEPFLDALVEVSWPAGRLQREYPILLDPPGYDHAKVNAPTVAAAPAAPVAAPKSETPPAESPAVPPSTASAAPAAEGAAPSAKAEMPAGAQDVAQPTGDTYGPIEKGETLSRIAGQVKPADVSLEQMLVALYRQNKDAFSGSNMNRLKTGQILRIPTEEEINETKLADARKEIHAQVTDWNAYRGQLAGGVASAPAQGSAPNAASGRVASAAVSAPAPTPAAPSDTLKISKSDSAGSAGAGKGGTAANAERLNALQEELTSKNKALQESQSRVADLEKQIQDMQRLLALKSAAPAKADTKVAAVPPPAAPNVEPAKPAEPPKAAEAPKAPEPAKPEPAKPAEPAPTTTVATATPTPAPAPAPTSEAPKTEPPKTAAKPKAAPKKAPPAKGFVDELLDNPAYLAGGVGLIALIGIAGFMVSRRRRYAGDGGSNSQMTSAFPSDLKAGSTTGKPAAGLVDTGNSSFLTDFDKTGPGTIDTDEVDPVAEAEVYIAYGRDAQAEEILKEAMARDKGRHEIALKLLEIYHARKSGTAFETVAKELRSAVGESSPLWQKAAAMGNQIDPTNPLYGSAAGGTATFTAMSPSAAPAKPNVDFDLEGGKSAGSAPAPSFDLDLGSQKPPAPDLPLDSAPNVDFNIAHTGSPSRGVSSEPVKEDKPAFDFDLSGLDLSSSKSAEPTPTASSSGGLDLADLSLDSSPSDGGEASGTKLELAKAYLEIGDKDGAREILHEVAKEGSSAQKEEAKKLIASL